MQRFVVLLLVAILTISALPALSASAQPTAPTAAQPNALVKQSTWMKVSNSPLYPVRGQTYTLKGNLTSRLGPMTNATISIYKWQYSSSSWALWKTVKTTSTGTYAASDSSLTSSLVKYQLRYAGTSLFYGSQVNASVKVGGTTTSLSYTFNDTTKVMFLAGYVKDRYGTGLVGVSVKLYWMDGDRYGPTHYVYLATVKTTSGGHFSYHTNQLSPWSYKAVFQGYPLNSTAKYWQSEAEAAT